MKKTVVFDLDGTLLDTIDDLAAALNYALKKNGFPTHKREAVLLFVGDGVANLVSRGMDRPESDPLFPTVFDDFRAYYAQHNADLTHPYEGIVALLSSLREAGIKVAVVSNKYDAAVKALSSRFFGELIPLAIGEGPTVKRKPSPDALLYAMEYLGRLPGRRIT
jgi:phosphoglycolate phosphatase